MSALSGMNVPGGLIEKTLSGRFAPFDKLRMYLARLLRYGSCISPCAIGSGLVLLSILWLYSVL